MAYLFFASAFYISFCFSISSNIFTRKKKAQLDNKASEVGKYGDSQEDRIDSIESLRQQLYEAEIEQKFLKDLFQQSVTLMDELQVAATDLVPDIERTQALYRLYETSDETDLGRFIQIQEDKLGKNARLDKLPEVAGYRIK